MTVSGWIEIALFLGLLTALTPVLGGYLARVYRDEVAWAGPVERAAYRLLRVDRAREQDWKAYARSVLILSAAFFAACYAILRTQGIHPLNPTGLGSGTWDESFNTTSAFVTNTDWQYYAGETTMSAFSQMAALAVQNFVSAAVGICVAIALIRGLASRSGRSLGNFWVDFTRTLLYVLAPLAVVVGVVLMSQGVLQNLSGPRAVGTVAGLTQTLGMGPVAGQEAIKLLGTNGGGYFNVNSAMPFENATWLSNFVEMLSILAIPAALTATYGRFVGNRRQGWVVFGAMLALFVVAVAVVYAAESHGTPAMRAAGIHGPNLEGKEQRFGIASSSLFVAVTTAASCGAVNAAMESLTALGGAVPMSQMMTGEVVFGGVGSGLYGMLLFVLLGVFICGLMVGRTPELLGKKVESREIELTVLGTVAVPLLILATTAVAIASPYGRTSIAATGPQGFSETLYAYVSQAQNNGSAFAGYTGYVQPDGTNAGAFGISFADVLGGLTMLGGRFVPMLIVLAVAGAMAGKRVTPPSAGTLRTDTPTFAVVLVATVVLIALLTFVPALLLGPVVQGLTHRLF
jgi:K+-transporting ATPase ATPase A chain